MPQFSEQLQIQNTVIGAGNPVYFIAELSANHNQDIKRALALVEAAAKAGANAIKLQTYTPDTITIKSDRPEFQVTGTIWEGADLYSLYQQAYTPWEWHKEIFDLAKELGLHAFSAPFDPTAVSFLEELNVPAYKIASSELVDIPLLKLVAETGKPVILSTGMANGDEIEEAVHTLSTYGCKELALLKCTAAYPADAKEANLLTIPKMQQDFNCPVGLSDHTLGPAVPITAAALGAVIIEKHFTLSRADGGPDASFSLEPDEFAQMVSQVNLAQESLGQAQYAPSEKEKVSLKFRRSLYVVQDVKAGDKVSPENIRSIRPANGLHTRHYEELIGKDFDQDIPAGTPLSFDMIKES